MTMNDLILTVLLGLMALLYASIGHAGSSGYQASMAIMGVSAELMKPTALCLNVIVALIGTIQFASRGYVQWQRLLWLVVTSVPAAYIGGYFTLPPGWYFIAVAVVLWFAAVKLWLTPNQTNQNADAIIKPLNPVLLLLVGGGLGFLSGLTGTGGGIFLTPLLILCGWATPRQAAGLSVAFILANSPAALYGWWNQQTGPVELPALLPVWMVLVAVCGWLGSWFGSKYGSPVMLRRVLALVLVIAGAKLLLQGLK